MARQKGIGQRVVFVVNKNNPREKPIYDFLEQQYNKSDTIKSILAKLLDGKPVDMSEYCDMTHIIPPVTVENEVSTTEVKQQNIEVEEQKIIKEEVVVKPKPKKEDKQALEIQANIESEWESYKM